MTTSKDIAEKFGKSHFNVLEAVKRLECPEEFAHLNFQGGTYLDGNGQQRPMYYITRDGFMFLVMGFNGKKAAALKVKFIQAFNQMEEFIRNRQQPKDLSRLVGAMRR